MGVWNSPPKFAFPSCRSLNMDFENQDKEKDNSSTAGSFNGNSTNNSKGQLYSLSFFHHFSVLRRLLFHPAMCVSSCFAAPPDGMELFWGSTCHQLRLCPWKLNLNHVSCFHNAQNLHAVQFVRSYWIWKLLLFLSLKYGYGRQCNFSLSGVYHSDTTCWPVCRQLEV